MIKFNNINLKHNDLYILDYAPVLFSARGSFKALNPEIVEWGPDLGTTSRSFKTCGVVEECVNVPSSWYSNSGIWNPDGRLKNYIFTCDEISNKMFYDYTIPAGTPTIQSYAYSIVYSYSEPRQTVVEYNAATMFSRYGMGPYFTNTGPGGYSQEYSAGPGGVSAIYRIYKDAPTYKSTFGGTCTGDNETLTFNTATYKYAHVGPFTGAMNFQISSNYNGLSGTFGIDNTTTFGSWTAQGYYKK